MRQHPHEHIYYLDPEEPEQEADLVDVSEKGLSRRQALAAGILGGLAVVGYSDTLFAELLWRRDAPEIHVLDNPEAKQKYPTTHVLAVAGFNVSDFEGLGKAVEGVLPNLGQIAYLEYSDNGIDMDELERVVLDFIEKNNVENLTLYGHSMGGMVAIELAARIKDKVNINLVVLDCTPTGECDLRGDGKAGTWLLGKTGMVGLSLGPIMRTVMESTSAWKSGHHDPLQVGLKALNKSFSSKTSSNKLIQSQANLIDTFNPAKYRGVFSPEMPIFLVRPDDYRRDPTVNDRTSFPNWGNGLGHVIIDVPVADSGHADPGQCRVQYEAALTAAIEKCGVQRLVESQATY